MATQFAMQPLYKVPDAFGGWNYIKWGWNTASLFKVANPKLTPCKLPFNICPFLWRKTIIAFRM
jgi:hypothetical protein